MFCLFDKMHFHKRFLSGQFCVSFFFFEHNRLITDSNGFQMWPKSTCFVFQYSDFNVINNVCFRKLFVIF